MSESRPKPSERFSLSRDGVPDTPVAADSSILSETLSNIDFNGLLELESDSSFCSDSTPVVPWNMHAGTRNKGGNTHSERRGERGPRKRRRRSPRPGKRPAHKSASTETTGIPMSRDFFLLVALCIGLACALMLLARPVISSLLFESTILPV